MFSLLNSLSGYKPLLYWRDFILLAKREKLYISDLSLNNVRFLVSLPSSFPFQVMRRFRLLCRAKRLEIGPVCLLDDDIHCLIWHEHKFWVVNLKDGTLRADDFSRSFKRPLSLCFVDIPTFDRGVYFGDYISNHRMKSVDIFRMGDDGIWRTAFSFPENTINHIHSLIADPLSESIYVLTGDYGSAASIWKASKNFSVVERVCTPGQEVRACWLSVKGDNLFYATDSHTSINHCMVINTDVCDALNPIPLHEIPGSSIYFLPSTDSSFVYFSTSVEPAPSSSNLFGLFSRVRGPGILSDNSYIFFWDFCQDPIPIYSARKDVYPFRIFQFGAFQFPSGICPDSSIVHAYGSALEGVDGATIALSRC